MIALEITLLCLFGVYALVSLLLLRGIFVPATGKNDTSRRTWPRVSVLVAARNEERYLAACLQTLVQCDYPAEHLEILVIDDRSTDRTREIAADFAHRHPRVRVVSLTQRLAGMSGKASALCQGLAHATGEIILVTDADCLVPPTWVAALVRHFTPQTGLVGGFTLLSPFHTLRPAQAPDHCGSRVQTLDWMFLLAIGAGAAGWGRPLSILGNNFGFRRQAYEQVGGYQAIGFTIIEDFALMQRIVRTTAWRVRFPLDPATAIYSFPPASWREFLHQRQRWAAGGKEMGLPAKTLMGMGFSVQLALVLAAVVSPALLAAGLLLKLGSDFAVLWRCASVLRARPLLRSFLLFEGYFFLYSFVLAPTILLPATVQWKDVRYRWNVRGQIKSVEEMPGAAPR
ncbi:MAG: glycosyltransferase [candidate division KSB1 bacterium]|nr:glycosyltransferase [candidate division KSB1 bacterium]MDZ7274436.1 glycosyltransferase [candidate division KSB1 bacterium]MDZ7284902.1 glycosyltransferase [candidate division KSB1 bacterium]MDZ7297677.1 glycosyltransferase [candidate division KSB1 bacterium]MDZ7305899.1 glycosyltransferase [candidate division KSB1 bacterium]